MDLLQRVYFHAPVALQNVMVSAYGYVRARKRFGAGYHEVRALVADWSQQPGDRADQWVCERWKALVKHASRHVPYYRDLFTSLGESEDTLTHIDALKRLPVLTKATVQGNASRLRAQNVAAAWTTQTSGSTGTPLNILLDRYAYQLSMALLAAHEGYYGIGPSDRRATFGGRMVQPIDHVRPPFWRYNHAERQMLFSSYHLSSQTVESYIDALRRFEPAEIIGYPSAISTLAQSCVHRGWIGKVHPRVVVTNSETLLAWQREVIERAFQAPVADYYGSAESVVFASQCDALRYHPEPLMGITEVLDEFDRQVAPGETGRLVCTTLANWAMPLVRYDTADIVRTASGPCPCGRGGPSWEGIVGRTDDLVHTPDGRAVGRLDHVFKGVRGVIEAQIAQTGPDRVQVRVVPGAEFDRDVEFTILRNLEDRLGTSMRFSVVRVPSIPRSSRGKFRGVVNEIGKEH